MLANRFARYAWVVLIYNLGVILWGAFVRATGSGAGCGSHWPLCNGQVVPQAPQVETLIEFSHRLTSGLSLLLVLAMFVWAWRAFPKGHSVRLGAGLSLFFIVTEALIGAGIVLLELVADNASMARAAWMAAHLLNTFLLLGALTLTAWWASGGEPVRLRRQGSLAWLLGLGIGATLFLGMSGAVTALGDTLFPAASLAEGIRQEFSPAANFMVRLRIFHPVIAVITGLYLVVAGGVTSFLRPTPLTRRLARSLTVLYLVQLGVGLLNVALLAPVWMQLVHLLLADFVWIALVLLAATALAESAQPLPVERRQARVGLEGGS